MVPKRSMGAPVGEKQPQSRGNGRPSTGQTGPDLRIALSLLCVRVYFCFGKQLRSLSQKCHDARAKRRISPSRRFAKCPDFGPGLWGRPRAVPALEN